MDHREHLRDQSDGAKRSGGSSLDGDGRNNAGEWRRQRCVRVDDGDGETACYGANEEAGQVLRGAVKLLGAHP